MRTVSLTGIALLAATTVFADATVDQKTQVRFGGAMSIVNVFGGKSTHEGLESSVVVKGNRKLTRTGGSGELVDLDAEKIYRIDYDRKTYKVTTFDELRRQYEEAKKRAEKDAKSSKADKNEGPEMEVEFDVKSTGKKETINGFNTHQEIVTVTVHEKGKKLEQSGGWVLTADMAMGPKLAAMKEMTDFDRRYMQKLYGSAYTADMQSLAAAMAATPAFGKAMKVFAEKGSSLDGSPIRTILSFETVAAPGSSSTQTADRDDSSQPSSVAAAAIGGLFNKIQKKRQENAEKSGSASAAPSAPNRSKLFDSTSEVLKAASTAAAGDVALPADFKQK